MVGLGFVQGQAFSQAGFARLGGSLVVGRGYNLDSGGRTSSEQAFIWNSTQGILGLGFLPGDSDSTALGVSRDGATVVGGSFGAHPLFIEQAFVWDATHGMRGLGLLPGESSTEALQASGDGSVIAGHAFSTDSQGKPTADQAFVWDAVNGLRGLGFLPGDSRSLTHGISDDGSLVIGDSFNVDALGNIATDQAFLWDAMHGMRALGVLPGESTSFAKGATRDASVIVGGSQTLDTNGHALTSEAFIWDAANGMRALGSLPGENLCVATSIAATGQVAGACSVSATAPPDGFIWDPQRGMRKLSDLLGAAVNGWTRLTSSQPLGHKIVGSGIDPNGHEEAWVADLPEPNGESAAAVAALSAIGVLTRRVRGRAGAIP
jgi:uncharacterized membrane protein